MTRREWGLKSTLVLHRVRDSPLSSKSFVDREIERLARSCHVFFRSNEASPKENAGGVIHQSRQVAASYLRTSRLFASSDNIPAIGDPRASGTTVNNTFLCKKSRRLAHFLARFCCTELSRPSHH
ncbi:hypothetical protein Ae201684_010446 [Aphanomyces euteiches]|uniref:Uncharacterized protein n=1 Tax=Aphanomyces euteiches TaxID=100861 RepID=A0A6G0WY31_9STRA|nr:hypothetical protein Ae201684_010446 [Aphanomyces euteiches]